MLYAEEGHSAKAGASQVDALLVTSPPAVSAADALRVAGVCYPEFRDCSPLAGERDVNFRIAAADGRALTLKFINAAERLEETAMQVAVLKHLDEDIAVAAPHHQPAVLAGAVGCAGVAPGMSEAGETLDWILYRAAPGAAPVRVRAYGFLEGRPGMQLQASPEAFDALGKSAAMLGLRLSGFDHPAAHRQLLWDTSQVLGLRPMLGAVSDAEELRMIEDYLACFERQVSPVLDGLPRQVIHNDLSPSNILVDDDGLSPVGILDFGDMVVAPRIAEIAIAASYQMGRCGDPLGALAAMVKGYESIAPLSADERSHVLDLVLARLVQRMVITSWRAARFPSNRDYILRSHAAATALFVKLFKDWKRGVAKAESSAPAPYRP